MSNSAKNNVMDVSYTDVPMKHQNESSPVYCQDMANDSFVTRAQTISNLVSQNVDVVNHTLDVTSQIADVYRESQQLAAKVEVVKEYGKIELAKTAAKFQTTKHIIEEVFGERREALSRYYKTLDHAIETGEKGLIVSAMQNISSIVVSSPLSDIQNFMKVFEDKTQPLLDF